MSSKLSVSVLCTAVASLAMSGCNVGSRVGSHQVFSVTHCERQIQYQERGVKIGATTFPGTRGNIQIGEIDVTPTTLRQTSDLIEAMDNEQFVECQQALNLSSDAAKEAAYQRSDQTRLQMTQLVIAVKNSTTEQQQVNALHAAQAAAPAAAAAAGQAPSAPAATPASSATPHRSP